jgi:hypothetical protein
VNRISVVAGVRETILVGAAGMSTDVPSSSWTVSGNGTGVGAGVALTLGAAVALGLATATLGAGAVADGPLEHAATRIDRTTARMKGTPPRRRDGAGIESSGTVGPEGFASTRETPHFERIEGGVRWWAARSCLPFSRRFEHAP